MKKTLLNISDLQLVFDLKKSNSLSLRESFINFTRAPLETLFSSENLFHCLKNINLSIIEGDRVGILGVNGSGKSSLCQIMSGNLHPTQGRVDKNCNIRSVLSTTPIIFPDLTGLENARILARLLYSNCSKPLLEEIVDESILFSDLTDFKNVPIKNYSKGMSSRLFLSLVTARPTEFLIMDETFDGADMFFMSKLEHRLDKVISESKASVFINHDIEMIKKYSNRVIVMNRGEIHFDGDPIKGIFYYQNKKWPNER